MKFMQNSSIDGVFFDTFSVTDENGRVFDFFPGGRDVQLTEENKEVYLNLRGDYELITSIQNSVQWIKEGLFSVFPQEFLSGFSPLDLDFLISGTPFINVAEWQRYTVYRGEFTNSHRLIKWFWECIYELSQEELRDLLIFITGTSRVPIEGFQALKTTRGDPAPFTLEPMPYFFGALPRAHTCFNRMDLPLFQSKYEIKQSLLQVLTNHKLGFGLE
jgi:hypothetical protein